MTRCTKLWQYVCSYTGSPYNITTPLITVVQININLNPIACEVEDINDLANIQDQKRWFFVSSENFIVFPKIVGGGLNWGATQKAYVQTPVKPYLIFKVLIK